MTVLALPTPDWLGHTLTVSGPAADVVQFQEAAAGAGAIPWHYDLDRMQEDWFHRMLAPDPAAREISVAGARILAETYRGLVGSHHEWVLAAVGRSRACPFDLHALVPVPDCILRLGPDDPASLRWLWENWGTTWPLKHVRMLAADDRRLRHAKRLDYTFLSADWTPWQAILAMRARWPALGFAIRPEYGDFASDSLPDGPTGQAPGAGRNLVPKRVGRIARATQAVADATRRYRRATPP